MYRKLLIIIIFLTTFYLLLATYCRAQTVTLSVYPPILEAVMKPGKSILIAYRIQNGGDPTTLTVSVLPFIAKDELGNVEIQEEFTGPVRFQLDNADMALNSPIFVKTGGSKQILLRIRTPDGIPEGDYYYTLVTESSPPPTTEGISSSRTKARIGSPILITVTRSGAIDIKGRVGLFSILPHYKISLLGKTISLFDSTDPIPLIFIIENKGSNMIKPNGEIVLRGNFGESASYDILPQNILAYSRRLVIATPSASFNERPVSLALKGFFVGKYSLSTNVNFGENSPQIFASTSFYAIPFKFIIALIFIIFAGIVIVRRYRDNEA
jgi:hypothetical protein